MTALKKGDTIKVHYTGKIDDGTVFDTSKDREPLEFTIGEGKLIPGFEDAVLGLSVGDVETVKIPAEEAYGEKREDMKVEIDKKQIPDDINPEIGQRLQIQQKDGGSLQVTVTKMTDTTVTLDANHELAGEDLTFEIEVLEVL